MGRNRGMFFGVWCTSAFPSKSSHLPLNCMSLAIFGIQDLQRPIVLHPRIWAVLCQIAKEKGRCAARPVPGQKYTGCLTQIVQAW